MTQDSGMPLEAPAENKNRTTIIIVVVVIVLLCCCCCGAVSGWWLWNNFDSLSGQFGLLSLPLLL